MRLSLEIVVLNRTGRPLSPCALDVAEREVALGRARWVNANTIRLRFNPFRDRVTRRRILQRDAHTCVYCGQPATTIDHLIPWSKGGRTTMPNCVAACSECNGARGDQPLTIFIATRKIRVEHPMVQRAMSVERGQQSAAALAQTAP